MLRLALYLLLACGCCWMCRPADGQERDLIGYGQLQAQLGGAMPTGAGVTVAQIEALEGSAYAPDAVAFPGKTITLLSGPTGSSGHATGVGLNFYGGLSVAPGVSMVNSYAALIGDPNTTPLSDLPGWLTQDYLHTGTALAPDVTTARVANHSWISAGSLEEILRRVDFVVERDDFIQVAAANNGINSLSGLLLPAYNPIVVGLTSGSHATTTTNEGGIYSAGRTKPDLVAPAGLTSFATPLVSGAAALLVDAGAANPGWSDGSYVVTGVGVIQHATASETIKAVLMAGADRVTHNNTAGFAEITDYARTTANGLDVRFGAGQVNVFNSYNILAAGEQGVEELGQKLSTGWDYVSSYDGLATNSYEFAPTADGTFTAALAWNVLIDPTDPSGDEISNLDLALFDVTTGQFVQSSLSTSDNTENLWTPLVANHTYRLDVFAGSGFVTVDYALAWQALPVPVPEPTGAALAMLVAGVAAFCLRRPRGKLAKSTAV